MMAERGISVDHTNIYCWIQKFSPKMAIFAHPLEKVKISKG